MSMLNRLSNCHNRYQGSYKKVLCVCSAGMLRAATAAVVLAQEPFSFNTRCAGVTTEYALVPVDDVLLEWADEIVCMEESHAMKIREIVGFAKPIVVLNIEDCYEYRDPALIDLIRSRYPEASRTAEKESESGQDGNAAVC